jgi:gliding motility-associated-like protein
MIRIYLSVLLCLFLNCKSFSQQVSSCPNLDFETGTLSNWVGYLGECCVNNNISINTGQPGIVFGRHTIMSGTGTDPNSEDSIPVVAPGGGNYSVRLGNDDVNRQAEALQYTMIVDTNSELFIYRYAVVLEDPSHLQKDQPRFQIRMYDQNGDSVGCGSYNVISDANIPGFHSYHDVRYKTWTTVGINLTPWLGQQVTIEFRTGDCNLGGHYGYAYLDCTCGPLKLENAFCPNSANVVLRAPQGFASYLWSTGGTNDTIVVPSANAGMIYTCTITSITGCTVTLETSIASTSVEAAFNIVTNCQNNFSFADVSTAFNGSPLNWLWDFGDGTTSVFQNPVHSFPTPGNQTVMLITQSDKGCLDTVATQISVWPAPKANFRVENVCEGFPTSFVDSSSIAWGNIIDRQWSFSDGTTSTQISPAHQFPNAGGYTAQLITTSDLGCVDTMDMNFTVYTMATVEAGPDTIFCGSGTVNIGNLINPALDYLWIPSSGILDSHSLMTSVNIPDPVAAVEHYYYTLTGRDYVSGCVSRDSLTIEAKAIPVAIFSEPAAQCFNGNSFDFSATTTISGSMYVWNFGQHANPSTSVFQMQNGVHYQQPGIFPLLLVTNNNGCVDSAVADVRVVEEPVIQLHVLEVGCPPLVMDFNSLVLPAVPHTYEWTFSDNSTSSDSTPTHTFTDPGVYSVELTVSDADGCKDRQKIVNGITVLPKPDSKFAVEPNVASIVDPHFSYVNLSQNGFMVNWDFGDNSFSSDSNTSHTYRDTGLFFVSLVMKNTFGCTDTTLMPVRVEPYFTFYVPNSFTPNGDGVNDNFRGLGLYFKEYEMRIYNRWGKVIYVTNDYDRPWDGKGDLSNPSQNEVYDYLIVVKDMEDKDHKYIGHVSLVR